jgi:hypothetical protein
MPEEPIAQELKSIWKDQPEERIPMHQEQFVNRRLNELYSSTRSEIMMSIGAALFFAAVMAWRFGWMQSRLQELGLLAIIAWAAVSLYWLRDRIWRKEPVPPDALAATGLEHYRKELQRRRDHLRNEWVWHGPLVLACITLAAILTGGMLTGTRRLMSVLPLMVVLVLWSVFGFVRRRRLANALQKEIESMRSVGP